MWRKQRQADGAPLENAPQHRRRVPQDAGVQGEFGSGGLVPEDERNDDEGVLRGGEPASRERGRASRET